MNEIIKRRVLKEAQYIIETKSTIRKVAQKFDVSKSTVHNDLNERIKQIDESLAKKVNEIFKNNDKYKHIRGGEATKEKYKRGKTNEENKQFTLSNR